MVVATAECVKCKQIELVRDGLHRVDAELAARHAVVGS